MKLEDLLNYNSLFQTIIDKGTNVKPTIKFKLLGYIKQFSPYLENFETVRNDLVMKYGEEDESGNYKVDPNSTDTWKKFESEFTALVRQEIDVNLPKIKANEIMSSGIPAKYLVGLYDLIEE